MNLKIKNMSQEIEEYDPLDDPKFMTMIAEKAFSEAAEDTMKVMGYNTIAKNGWVIKLYADGHEEKIKKI